MFCGVFGKVSGRPAEGLCFGERPGLGGRHYLDGGSFTNSYSTTPRLVCCVLLFIHQSRLVSETKQCGKVHTAGKRDEGGRRDKTRKRVGKKHKDFGGKTRICKLLATRWGNVLGVWIDGRRCWAKLNTGIGAWWKFRKLVTSKFCRINPLESNRF